MKKTPLPPNPPGRADDVNVTRPRAAIVLPHHISFQREVFIEGVADADGETIADPIVQTPVIKELIVDHPYEFRLADFKRMFELQPVAITPGVNLRLAPAPLEPVARIESEFTERHAQVRAYGPALLSFMPAVGWPGLAMKILSLERDVTAERVIEANAPALVDRLRQIIADAQCADKHELGFLVQRNRELDVVPTLRVVLRNDESLTRRGRGA